MPEPATPPVCQPPLRPHPISGWDLEVTPGEITKPIDFAAVFGRRAPVHLEVGCGSGLFLAIHGPRFPHIDFFGIEVDGAESRRAKDKWRRRNLLNTRIVRSDAFYFLEEYVPEASLDAMIILFSDPWPKTRHHKRRVFRPQLLPILARVLKPGADLIIKTDVTEYYNVMIELFQDAPFLELLTDKRIDLQPEPDDIVTNFQSKALAKGHPIHAMHYRKK